MRLYESQKCPHTCSTYTVASTRDSGGGTTLTYTLAQSGIPCSINTTGASEIAINSQMGQVVTHTIAILASLVTTTIVRGMKVVADDGNSYHVEGIRYGRQYGSIPPFVYLQCKQQI